MDVNRENNKNQRMDLIGRKCSVNAGNTIDVPIDLLDSDDEKLFSDDDEELISDNEDTRRGEINKNVRVPDTQSHSNQINSEEGNILSKTDKKRQQKSCKNQILNENQSGKNSCLKIPNKNVCRLASRRKDFSSKAAPIITDKSSKLKYGRARRALLGYVNESSKDRSSCKTVLSEAQKKELLTKLRKERDRDRQQNSLRKACETKKSKKMKKSQSSVKHPVIILDSDIEDYNCSKGDGTEFVAWSDVSSMSNDSHPPPTISSNFKKTQSSVSVLNTSQPNKIFSKHSRTERNNSHLIEAGNQRNSNDSNFFPKFSKNNSDVWNMSLGSTRDDKYKEDRRVQSNQKKTMSSGWGFNENEKRASSGSSNNENKTRVSSGWGNTENKKRTSSGWGNNENKKGTSSGWESWNNNKTSSSVQGNHDMPLSPWKNQDKCDNIRNRATNDDVGTSTNGADKSEESFLAEPSLEQSQTVQFLSDKTSNNDNTFSKDWDSKNSTIVNRKQNELMMVSTPTQANECSTNSFKDGKGNNGASDRDDEKYIVVDRNIPNGNNHYNHISSSSVECCDPFDQLENDSQPSDEKCSSTSYDNSMSNFATFKDADQPSSGAIPQIQSKNNDSLWWDHSKKTVLSGLGGSNYGASSSERPVNAKSLLDRNEGDYQNKVASSGWGQNETKNCNSSGWERLRSVDKFSSSWINNQTVASEHSTANNELEKDGKCSDDPLPPKKKNKQKEQKLGDQVQSTTDNSLTAVVESNGLVMVSGGDNKKRRFLFPWPARIVSAEESDEWRQKCKKNHLNIAPNKVCVIYFFPCWESCLSFHVGVPDNWWYVDFVDESNIFPFEEMELDTKRLPENVLSRYQRGITVAKGLKQWAVGADLKKRKAQYKCKVEGTNVIHHSVVEYGAILKIRDDEWLETSKSLDPSKIIEMINFELPGYNSQYLKNSQKRSQNSVNITEDTIALSQNPISKLPSGQISPNIESQEKKRGKSLVHNLFAVIDETKKTKTVINGGSTLGQTIKTEDSSQLSSPSMHFSLYRALGTQNKLITKSKESSNIYRDLEMIPHITGSSDVNGDSVLNILSKLCKRINKLEEEKDEMRKELHALQKF